MTTSCPRCGLDLSHDGRCAFCIPPKEYHSAEEVVRRYFALLGRSGCPALDPSQESTRGGSVGPVPAGLHERARLSRILDLALGDGWIGQEVGRALIAFYGPSAGARADMAAESCGASISDWGRLAGAALRDIRGVLGEKEKEETVVSQEQEEVVYRTWKAIAERLGVSISQVIRWWMGQQPDPCGVKDAIKKRGYKVVYATESDLAKCFNRLWVDKIGVD